MNFLKIHGTDDGNGSNAKNVTLVLLILALLVLVPRPGWAMSLGAYREYQPVVIPGATLASWLGSKDVTKIGLFVYNSSSDSFSAIPFQIDKKRHINLKFNVNDPNSFAGGINVCEFGYFRELGVTAGSTDDHFASNMLQATDEIVFMAFDAGTDPALTTSWFSGTDTNRYELILTDPLTGAKRYVYAYYWNSGNPTKSSTSYVSWSSGSSCNNGTDSCGTGQGLPGSLSSAVNAEEVHFTKNWVVDEFHVNSSSSAFYLDIVDRWQYQHGGENEDTWSDSGAPRFLGVYTNQTSDYSDKAVRIVRAIQGAQSGADTTKYEFIYPTEFVTRVNLRVHEIQDLYARIDQESAVATDSPQPDIWTATSGTSKMDASDVGANGPATSQTDQNATYGDWTEVLSKSYGSYIEIHRDPRPVPASAMHYTYIDKAGKVGMFGREWDNLGLTQDGAFNADDPICPGCAINDGGCNGDEESTSLNYARIEQTLFPRPNASQPYNSVNVKGSDFNTLLDTPMTFVGRPQTQNAPIPLPTPTCSPGLTSASSSAGPVSASLTKTGCGSTLGFRVYRSTGSGSYYLLQDIGSGSSFIDLTAAVGTTYNYAVSSYNEVDTESSLSSGTSVTSTDTTPPAAPTGVTTVGSNGKVTVTWSGSTARDIAGYNVWMANGSGGTYSKQNGAPLTAYSTPHWDAIGLTNGQSYCFKIEATDLSANTSSQSSASCATPGP